MQQSLPPKRHVPKPSLLSSSDQGEQGNVRILTSLSQGVESPSAVNPARRRFGLFAFVFGLVAVAVAVTVMSGPESTLAVLSPVTAPSQSVLVSVAVAGSGDTPVQAQLSPTSLYKSESTPAQDAAIIVTDEVPAAVPNATTRVGGLDKLTTALEAGIKSPPAVIKTALEAASVAPDTKPITHSPHAIRAANAKPNEHVTGAGTQSAKTDRQVDSDINLITALVAHTDERETKQAMKATALMKPQKLAPNNKNIVRTSVNTLDRNQDVVERQVSDSTEFLLERCKSLGFIEGQLCRWRICSGRWDSDAACKVK